MSSISPEEQFGSDKEFKSVLERWRNDPAIGSAIGSSPAGSFGDPEEDVSRDERSPECRNASCDHTRS